MISPAAELNRLLLEGPREGDLRARSAFDQAAEGMGNRVVIYGAGNLGRRVLEIARTGGLDTVAFVDADPGLWGKKLEGCPILNPCEAARLYSLEALFVVAVWHPSTRGGMRDILGYLRGLGCRAVPFVPLFWREAERCLPYYLWDLPGKLLSRSAEVIAALQLFEGDANSETEFVRQIALRLRADFAALAPPATGPQYFPTDLFGPSSEECFVDCGAYDGDSIAEFSRWAAGRFRRVIGLEADPVSFDKLVAFLAQSFEPGRSRALPFAVGERREKLRFAASGRTDAAITGDGGVEVQCVPLDELLEDERATFIKMDIEGAEETALLGGRQILARDRPLLAICVYHQIDHLWTIPLLMSDALGDSHFALRSYRLDGLDTVCFAVPPERWRGSQGTV